eukprot:COSAG02_NODE_4244_length_5593_cov_2.391518_4_plen_78_part_00
MFVKVIEVVEVRLRPKGSALLRASVRRPLIYLTRRFHAQQFHWHFRTSTLNIVSDDVQHLCLFSHLKPWSARGGHEY